MSSKIILCQVKRADEPYYIEDINRYLYSIEELCWFVDHNLALVDDAFFDTTLTDWIRGELQLPDLADRMDRIMSSGREEDEPADEKAFIAGIGGGNGKQDTAEAEAERAAEGRTKSKAENKTESKTENSTESKTENRTENKTENRTESKTEKESESDSGSVLSRLIYVLNAEISWIYVPDRQAFREEIAGLRRMSAGERMKRRADTLIGYEKYTRALQIYKRILRDEEEEGRLKPYMETVSGKYEADTGTADMTAERTTAADTSAEKAEAAGPTATDATAADTAVSDTEAEVSDPTGMGAEVSDSAGMDAAVDTVAKETETDIDTVAVGTTSENTENEVSGPVGTNSDTAVNETASDLTADYANAAQVSATVEENAGQVSTADNANADEVSVVDAAIEISAEENTAGEESSERTTAEEDADPDAQGMTEITADGSATEETASSAAMAESTGITSDIKTESADAATDGDSADTDRAGVDNEPDSKTENVGTASGLNTDTVTADDAQEDSMAADDRTAVLCGAVWHNMGVAYARLFQFDEACGCMKRAYNLLRSNEILRDYLCCVLISRGREAFDDLADRLGTDTVTRAEIVSSVENIPVKKTPANIDEALNTWVRDYHRQTAP